MTELIHSNQKSTYISLFIKLVMLWSFTLYLLLSCGGHSSPGFQDPVGFRVLVLSVQHSHEQLPASLVDRDSYKGINSILMRLLIASQSLVEVVNCLVEDHHHLDLDLDG